jgi:hypothetical protein
MTIETDPGWGIYPLEGRMHVMPVSERDRHRWVGGAADWHLCPCGPHEDEGIIVHSAFDGRHEFENGERKTS